VIELVALLKLKSPRIEMQEVTRSDDEQAWFRQLVVEIAQAIEAEAFPPNPSWACSDCEFGEHCRVMCVIQSIAITETGPSRSPKPVDGDHRKRFTAIGGPANRASIA
jgi:hypothetical protein